MNADELRRRRVLADIAHDPQPVPRASVWPVLPGVGLLALGALLPSLLVFTCGVLGLLAALGWVMWADR